LYIIAQHDSVFVIYTYAHKNIVFPFPCYNNEASSDDDNKKRDVDIKLYDLDEKKTDSKKIIFFGF